MLSSKRQAGAMPGACTSALLGAVGLCERFKELLPRALCLPPTPWCWAEPVPCSCRLLGLPLPRGSALPGLSSAENVSEPRHCPLWART